MSESLGLSPGSEPTFTHPFLEGRDQDHWIGYSDILSTATTEQHQTSTCLSIQHQHGNFSFPVSSAICIHFMQLQFVQASCFTALRSGELHPSHLAVLSPQVGNRLPTRPGVPGSISKSKSLLACQLFQQLRLQSH